ncbi:hypothetical protein CC1G_03717 [Coprinopsis cinerea okayama7|uniref:Uncharacterized protein n=1 Tax=Coprinopsis cinerea (strain Okayama-7 / 130 / ATCC MYA-4618 / FGSC 9003) TaxID=240176 RepID=A8N224_COPC7|nr:hypothetical protein CC1G_03717 [Coprinopsis cinerea okayama7\|eukprot:XP_001828923.2 hypothetical protein CC1G_03717 [Coprinopsis cinerea okayama7\
MSYTQSNHGSYLLHVDRGTRTFDSPSSSVFDLPPERPDSGPARAPLPLTSAPADLSVVKPGDIQQSRGSGPSYIIISGGTGGNSICSSFADACFVLPVSDDGGSSSEIIRVLGGPSVGDIRSRLVRLIPQAPPSSPLDAIRNLLAHRLPSKCSYKEAREEWRDIVEGRSPLWRGIPNDRKETIRGFLVSFESELLKRAHKNFDFRNGSIGNYFIAAAQNFFRSLPSAIFLFSSITNSQAHILPVIVTNHTVTLAAELEDGERLVGQCEISHPVASISVQVSNSDGLMFAHDEDSEGIPVAANNVMYDRTGDEPIDILPAPISKVYYINSYGMEIHPTPNPDFIFNLKSKDILVYSCGSLWTSIMPCLALRGVATAIASSHSLRAKVLLLNAENDRETYGYSALDYIKAIVRTLNTNYSTRQYGLGNANTMYPASAFITDLVYLSGTTVKVDRQEIAKLGVKCTEIPQQNAVGEKVLRFEAETVREVLDEIWLDRREE